MQQGMRSRGKSLLGCLPVSVRFYERSLDLFQVFVEGVGGAFVMGFRFLVAVQEWMGRRFLW
jgi:hypothetical protein